MSLNAKVNRGVAWTASAQAVIAIADLVSQLLVVALWIPKDDLGLAALAFPFYTMLDTAANVSSSLIQRDDHTPERVSTVFWFNLMVSGALFVALLGLGPLYGWIMSAPVVGWLLIAYGGKLLFQNVYTVPLSLLKNELRFGDVAVARVVAHLAESISRVVYAAAGATVWCWTLAVLTRSVVFGVFIQIRHPYVPKLVFKPREIAPHVRFGLRTAASQVLYQLYTNLDYPIVGYFFGKAANGIYSLAYFIVLEPVKTIANVVTDVAFPTFARVRANREQLVDQLIRLTRLNLIAVLPFVVLIVLVVPEFLHVFYQGRHWSAADLAACTTVARILCVVGVLRALGLLGPPLLDGIGRPELTLRYQTFATLVVPAAFVVSANVLGGRLGFLSVAVGWAAGYPLAFALLSYLVVKTVELPVRAYLRGVWGIFGCCVAGLAAGLAVAAALAGAGAAVRLVAVGLTALAVTLALLATWQKITPRSIAASLRG